MVNVSINFNEKNFIVREDTRGTFGRIINSTIKNLTLKND